MIRNGIELKTEKTNYGDKVQLKSGTLYEYPDFVIVYYGSIPEDVDAGNGRTMRQSRMAYGVITEEIDKIIYLTHDGLIPNVEFKLKGQTYIYDHDCLVKAEDHDGQFRSGYVEDLDA